MIKNKLIFFLIIGFVLADPPNWDGDGDGVLDNYNDYENNGSITAIVTTDGLTGYAGSGDMIAAFVGDEQRGISPAIELPPFFGGGYNFQMVVYSNEVDGEVITFQYYNQSVDAVYNLSETMEFTVNMIAGDAFDPFIFTFNPGGDCPSGVYDCADVCDGDAELDECGECNGDGECDSDLAYIGTPNWDGDGDGVLDNYNDYENNGSITAIVTTDGLTGYAGSGDMIAAFVGDEQRGISPAIELPPFFGGGYNFQMVVYSNEVDGEVITFQYYNQSVDAVYNLSETMEFTVNMIVGDAFDPFIFTFNPGGDVPDPIYGCMNQDACNYNIEATNDDGSCEYADDFYNCDDECISDSDGDGVCDELEILGCTNPDGLNYNPDATDDDDSCLIMGCTDSNACNFDSDANADDESCEYPEDNYDCDENCIVDLDCAGVCGGDSYQDECGTCDSLPWNDCVQDCNGDWGGDALIDECGVCDGQGAMYECGCSDISEGSCDCDGNILDDCGVCDGPGEIYECGCNNISEGDCDCDGNILDECGICGGDDFNNNNICDPDCPDNYILNPQFPNVNENNVCVPDLFTYNISTISAGYLFYQVTINGETVDDNDWVGAFNGDICVGSQVWDTDECSNNVCSISVMGFDNDSFTEGYMLVGDTPLFKIYDASENTYYDAYPSENIVWENFGFSDIALLSTQIQGCTDELACNFDSEAIEDDDSCEYPEDNYDCDGNCIVETDCTGECGGDAVEDNCGVCDGSGLNDDDCCGDDTTDCSGECGGDAAVDDCGVCDGPGLNDEGCCGDDTTDCSGECGGDAIEDDCGICDGDDSTCTGCTDSEAFNYDEAAIIDDGSCIFDFDLPPELFEFNQSTQQAFYFFQIVSIDNILLNDNDWVGAFNGDTCVGSKKWDISSCGEGICDLPVMGNDNEDYSDGYMEEGQIPTFKVYDYSEQEFYNAIPSENIEWESNGTFILDSLNVFLDCSGELAGDALVDDCGDCSSPEDYNSDQDDCGVCDGGNADQDCAGVCFGDALVDDCGDCSSPEGYNSDQDDCGVCEGDNSSCSGCTDSNALNYDDTATIDDDSCYYTIPVDISLHEGANLISFYALPEDLELETFVSPIFNSISGLITEGSAVTLLNNQWIGSILSIDPANGYWFVMDENDNLEFDGYPLNNDFEYSLHEGPNLISFPSEGSYLLEDILPENLYGIVYGIISEGESAYYLDDSWVGFEYFEGGKGYWFKSYEDATFSFNIESAESVVARNTNYNNKVLQNFEYIQSSEQAFYYFDNIPDASIGDWIIAYNGDVVVGTKKWEGDITDIAIMGYMNDDFDFSREYCKNGDIPNFVLYQSQTGHKIPLSGNIYPWLANDISYIGTLFIDEPEIPSYFGLNNIYPNPFNPTTTIDFSVPSDMEFSLTIFDLQGRLVETIINQEYSVGNYSIKYNASDLSSGIYFIQLKTSEFIDYSKVILLK